jgi:glycerophosphoryl diester phosphodiesterase
MKPPLVVGHRGAEALAPENTWPSFQLAVEAGADMVEIDVQLSGDGEAIVLHDFTLWPKLRDPRWVRDLSWEEMSHLDVGTWFGPAYAGQRIPRFADVLKWARGRLPLWVDLKHGFVTGEDHRLERTALELIDRAGMAEHVVIVSWDHVALAWIRKRRPELPLAVNLPQRLADPASAVTPVGARWAVVSWPQVDLRVVDGLHEAGIQVAMTNLFTADYAEALRLGVDAFFSGDPGEAKAALEGTRRASQNTGWPTPGTRRKG